MIIKQYTTANGTKKQMKGMAEEFKFGQMAADMKAIGKTIKRIF